MSDAIAEIQRRHNRCLRATERLENDRRQRDAAIRQACGNGVSRYAVAKAIGMTGRGVKKIVEKAAEPGRPADHGS